MKLKYVNALLKFKIDNDMFQYISGTTTKTNLSHFS